MSEEPLLPEESVESDSVGIAAEPLETAPDPFDIKTSPPIRGCEKFTRYETIALVMVLPAIGFLLQFSLVDDRSTPECLQGVVMGNVVAFGSLLAFWIVQGGRPLPWRLVVTAGLMAALFVCLFSNEWTWHGDFLLLELFMGGSVVLSEGVFFVLLRGGGLELVFGTDSWVWYRGRYSLGYLFQWMMAVAILSAILAWAPWRNILDSVNAPWWDLLLFGIIGAVPSLLLTLAVLGRRQRWLLRTGAALLALVLLVAFRMVIFSPSANEFWMAIRNFGLMFVTLVFWHLVVLVPLRLVGYRLVWRARREF